MIPKRFFIPLLGMVIFSCSAEQESSQQTPAYILTLKAPAHIKHLESISCIYHGNKLYFENGICQLPEHVFKTFFTLIITPLIEFKNNGTCVYAERLKDLPCKWYNLTLDYNQSAAGRNYSWRIDELKSEEMPLRIPEQSGIVIQLPASMIDALDNAQRTGRFVINLPGIILNEATTQEQLDSALNQAALNLPATNHLCQPACRRKNQGNTTIVARERRVLPEQP